VSCGRAVRVLSNESNQAKARSFFFFVRWSENLVTKSNFSFGVFLGLLLGPELSIRRACIIRIKPTKSAKTPSSSSCADRATRVLGFITSRRVYWLCVCLFVRSLSFKAVAFFFNALPVLQGIISLSLLTRLTLFLSTSLSRISPSPTRHCLSLSRARLSLFLCAYVGL
jgi:hypothetical protein